MHHIIYRFHKPILVFTAVLTLIAVIFVFRLKLDANLFSLLPTDNPSVHSFFEVTEKIGIQSLLIAIVDMPENYTRTQSEAFVDLFAELLSHSQWVNEVEYKAGTEQLTALFQTYLEYLPLFLKTEDMAKLTKKLSASGIRQQVLTNKQLLMTPFSVAGTPLIYKDPLAMRAFLMSTINRSSENRRIHPKTGYYHTATGNTYFLFIKPIKPPQDITFSQELMADMHRLKRRVSSQWSDVIGGPADHINISYTGGYPIAVNDEATTKTDIKVTLLSSFVGVMILFGLAFRTKKILLYVSLPLIISVLWTLGFAHLIFQRINLLSCLFSCVLIGLGIDFAIHIVNRYFDPQQQTLDATERLQITFQETGMGIIIGGISTAAAFYAIAISDFRGFRELGIITGTGVLICLAVMLFVLPSLLICFAKKRNAEKKITIAGFGLKPLMVKLTKYPKTVILVSACAVGLLVFASTKITFDDNLKHFRSADNETLRMQDQVTGWLQGSTAAVLLVAKGTSEDKVMATSYSILSALEDLVDTGMIAGVKSIGQYFPLPLQQRKNIAFVQQHPDVFDAKRIQKVFNKALEENGFAVLPGYNHYFEKLSKAFSLNEAILPSTLHPTDLGKILKPFVYRRGEYFKTVTYIQPTVDLWARADTVRFKKMIINTLEAKRITSDHYDLAGSQLLTGDLKDLIISNLESALWLAGISVVLVLILYYRNLKFFFLSLVPLIAGLIAVSGIMVIFSLDFNFLNVMVLPMIIGIGIDDGVHLVNTYDQSYPADMLEALSKTGRAVVLTSLTTLVGFGSITLSHYPGLRSMGYVAVIGIAACLLASVIVMPAVFSLMSTLRAEPR
ncbi:MAG: MMPL family transporter [Desulfobacterales bacterium]|nr:MAG: MMPL family transporter [Desulfobacterales bacterium]